MNKVAVTRKIFKKTEGDLILNSPVWERLDCGSAYAELNGLTGDWFCYGQKGNERYPYLVETVAQAARFCARIDHWNATGEIKSIPVSIIPKK